MGGGGGSFLESVEGFQSDLGGNEGGYLLPATLSFKAVFSGPAGVFNPSQLTDKPLAVSEYRRRWACTPR